MRLCSVSIDLDEVACYAAIHGLSGSAEEHAVYDLAVTRIRDFAKSADLKLTLFVVARDLEREPNRALLRRAISNGHEIGNHSLDHLYDLTRRPLAEQRTQIAQASDRIQAHLGVRPSGFRAPGYTVTDSLLATLREETVRLADEGLLGEEVIVSAGGSAWFDRVVEALEGQWLPGHTVRAVLRSGASVTHDDGFYSERTPFNREPSEGSLSAALELHAQVLSTPEPGLAIVGMGKRDAPFDEGLPVARRAGLTVTRMNDHHTYVAVSAGTRVEVGEVLRFGISHPCTAFDKWRLIPVIDDAGVVVDVLETYF